MTFKIDSFACVGRGLVSSVPSNTLGFKEGNFKRLWPHASTKGVPGFLFCHLPVSRLAASCPDHSLSRSLSERYAAHRASLIIRHRITQKRLSTQTNLSAHFEKLISKVLFCKHYPDIFFEKRSFCMHIFQNA